MKLSIIIPCFNVEKYIHKCLYSILKANLDFSDFEIITVNDGSSDNTSDIIESFKTAHPEVTLKIYEQINSGQSIARNFGLLNAKGKYVWFIDADDYIVPDKVSKLLNKAVVNDLDILWFDHDLVDEDGNLLPKPKEDIKINISTTVNTGDFYLKNGFKFSCMPVMFLFKRKFLHDHSILFIPNIYFEDILFTTKCIDLAQKMTYFDEKIYRYLIRFQGSTMRDPSKMHKRILDSLFVSAQLKKMASSSGNPNYFKEFSSMIAVYKLKQVAKMDVDFNKKVRSHIKEITLLPVAFKGTFKVLILVLILNVSYPLYNKIFKVI